jgi:energy-coupling factor transport system substrate-specific component
MRERAVGLAIYALSAGIGAVAFAYPFLEPVLAARSTADDPLSGGPLLLTVLVSLCFVALLFEVQHDAAGAKFVALLGILVAVNAVLRFVEVAVPGPGGFSPIFVLIVLSGYVFGGRFGFLMGALTLFVSAIITGGVGPWLPAQMFAAGWVGITAGLCQPVAQRLGLENRRAEVVALAAVAGAWGIAYGVIMNLWFWPFLAGPANMYWSPGAGVVGTLERYLTFYVATSAVWDLVRATGNVALVALVGTPTLRVLRRFQRRFTFSYVPQSAPQPVAKGSEA